MSQPVGYIADGSQGVTGSPGFDHWLITRFNVPLPPYPGRSIDPDWLSHRIRLFQSYCRPSVANQSCVSFRWLLLIDSATPDSTREAILGQGSDVTFELLPVNTQWHEQLADHLACASQSAFLLTTRLDNDDAICREYIETIQRAFSGQTLEFLEFRSGLRFNETTGELFAVSYNSGPFLSLIENRCGRPRTVYCCDHRKAAETAPLKTIELDRAWLQVVHQRNLKNRIEPNLGREHLSLLAGYQHPRTGR